MHDHGRVSIVGERFSLNTKVMRILVSNDDGYHSPGIHCLAEAVRPWAEVIVVAPDRERSGSSNALTLTRPLRARQVETYVYAVDGTPTDCVHLGLTGLTDQRPDLVVSGVNIGANMGDDILYSGTVAAATEGRSLGYPALAFSMASFEPRHWNTATRAIRGVMEGLESHNLPPNTILNVNIPDRPWGEIRGFRATRMGRRHPSEPVVRHEDPRGHAVYWIGQAGAEQDAGPGTDFHAVSEGYVSVTPISLDMTRHEVLQQMEDWLPDV